MITISHYICRKKCLYTIILCIDGITIDMCHHMLLVATLKVVRLDIPPLSKTTAYQKQFTL